jgi:hypothetical protein
MGGQGAGDERFTLAAERTRKFLLSLAAACCLELTGAVLAATLPVIVPGVALMCVAQLPLRVCDWHPDEDGVVIRVPHKWRPIQIAADFLLVATAMTLSAVAEGPAPAVAGAVFAGAVLWHITEVRRVASMNEADVYAQFRPSPTPLRLE